MFTGIIEEVARIDRISSITGGITVHIKAKLILSDLKIGDSVSINGVCLTVTRIYPDGFSVDAVGETLNKTTMKRLKAGDSINLERALKLSDRLGGHIVLGHVNGIGEIVEVKKLGENYLVEVAVPDDLKKYLVDEGSITVDGISLTVAAVLKNSFTISIIPHTWQNTNMHIRQVGGKVNLEVDILAKYVEKIFSNKNEEKPNLNEEWLKNIGY